ncbi:RagB/SusD family nutrient uptake outer membrane protein [Marinilabiliaceae bacterium JC017]|nr:RagB/SusD family nutrient uptake outer membrane protein [Marinilabiliaceae bacterium JC017]
MQKIGLLLVLSILIFSSCQDEYLDLYPQDRFTKNDFWKTTSDLEYYCNQFYSNYTFDVHGPWSPSFYKENNSDNLVPIEPNKRLNGSLVVPNTDGKYDWNPIRKANYFLENYRTVEGSENEINQYIGEIKFFKAYFYFRLLKYYGDLPWYNSVLDIKDEELYASRLPRNVVVDSIVSTLDESIRLLKSVTNAKTFRINKEIAMLFQSRVCLYEGTWEKYHKNTVFGVPNAEGKKYLEKAKNVCSDLISLGNYSLYSDGNPGTSYWSLFNQTDYGNNPEVMLWKQFGLDQKITHDLQRDLPWRGCGTGISLSLVNSYLNKDGSLSINSDYTSLSTLVKDKDPRLSQTVLFPGQVLTNVGYECTSQRVFSLPYIDQTGYSRNTTGFMMYKGINPDPFYQRCQEGISITGSIIFRYAEVYLNYAEATAELGEFTQNIADLTINKLRARVNMAPMVISNIQHDSNNILGVSDVIFEIRRERRVELAFENFRFDDLMRWRAHELFQNKKPKGMKFYGADLFNSFPNLYPLADENGFLSPYGKSIPRGYGFNPERDYLLPIPIQELNLNKNLKPNPGW